MLKVDILNALQEISEERSWHPQDYWGEACEKAHNMIIDQSAEIERLKGLLREAADDLADWGGYVPEYFAENHKLDDDIRKYREAGGVTK